MYEIASCPSFVSQGLKRLTDEMAEALITPFSIDELKAAVWGCEGDKAPGPDGFNLNFFKCFWSIFEQDLKEVVDYFYAGGSITAGCNSAFIALIPKVDDPLSVPDYRPISLIGCLNKIISKMLGNCLKEVVDFLIGEEQSAFIAGRFILDGPLIVNEIIAWLRSTKSKAFFLKLDFEKAYDMVSCGFWTQCWSKWVFLQYGEVGSRIVFRRLALLLL